MIFIMQQKHKIILRPWNDKTRKLYCRDCEREVIIDRNGVRRHKSPLSKKNYDKNLHLGGIRRNEGHKI